MDVEPQNTFQQDPYDESTWKDWPVTQTAESFSDTLVEGMTTNTFSEVDQRKLPLETPQLAQAMQMSQRQILQEALGFAIMGRNENLVDQLCCELMEELEMTNTKLEEFYPLHLAAAYLDGSKSCCNIMQMLSAAFRQEISRPNHLDHTVLDSLMLTILGSHTSLAPGTVGHGLRQAKQFPGEEVDICGRWDADSDYYRTLLSTGESAVPMQWKHKLCHTATQAICHCIMILCSIPVVPFSGIITQKRAPTFKTSGLFTKRCDACGLKMTLTPLQSVVMIGFSLAQLGAPNEDLFGVIAVMLCLLYCGANPREGSELSIELLFEGIVSIETGECCHTEMTALRLLASVPQSSVGSWSVGKQLSWKILEHILSLAEDNVTKDYPQNLDDGYDKCRGCRNPLYISRYPNLAVLWRAVQSELLTYRRQSEADPWLSGKIDLAKVSSTLMQDQEVQIGPLADRDMLKAPCACGMTKLSSRLGRINFPRASEVCKYYFSNLGDNWTLMNPIGQPGM